MSGGRADRQPDADATVVHRGEEVRLSVADDVAWLVMEQGAGANSFTASTVDAMTEALGAVPEGAGAVVLWGEGEFSVGADLEAFAAAENPTARVDATVTASNRFVRAVRAADRPVVAAVEGVAAGGGLGFALACDLLVLDSEAVLDPAYARIALTPDNGVPYFLTAAVGPYRARELLFDPGPVEAERARELGLVNRVVDDREFGAAVAAFAREQLVAPRATVGRTKRLVDSAVERGLDEHLERQRESIVAASRDPAFAERLRDFVD